MNALSNAHTRRGGTEPPNIGFASSVFPEAQGLITGVSVKYVETEGNQWYVLRVAYNQMRKAIEILDQNQMKYYFPLHYVIRLVQQKKKRVLAPLLPNLIFVYSDEDALKGLIENNPENLYLSYYYNHFVRDEFGKNPPLSVPYEDMMNFIHLNSIDNEHIKLVTPEYCHFRSGDKVKIIDGEFEGIIGKVARVAGQQRVIVEIEGLCLVATAYIPTAFLERLALVDK